MKNNLINKKNNINNLRNKNNKQKGFSLVELSIVLLIITILGALAYPKMRTFLIGGKTKPTADDIMVAINRIRANSEGTGNTPFTGVATATIANTLRERSNALTVTGVGSTATLQHKLGAQSAQITAGPATMTTLGDSFTVTVSNVNDAACPELATALQNNADIIKIGATTVKDTVNATLVSYNGQAASALCTAGDTNQFVFTFR
jgi:type IV pilus assembly protein PilA